MISQQVIQGAIGSHGNALRAGIIVFGDSGACHFVVIANEVGGRRAIEGALHALPIAIVHKGGTVERTLRRLSSGGCSSRSRGICWRGAGSGGRRVGRCSRGCS